MLRYPIVTLIVVILFLYATFFTALQFSPAAQRAFNNAVQFYGYATASVVLSSAAETALDLVKLENVELKKSAHKKQLRLDQFQGAAAQGIGWALNEEYVYGEDGCLQNAGFLDYRVPVCSDLPFIDTKILEIPNPNHPAGFQQFGRVLSLRIAPAP